MGAAAAVLPTPDPCGSPQPAGGPAAPTTRGMTGEKKSKSKRSTFKSFLTAVVVIPVISVLALFVVDFNRFIQIPYWTVFSVCYLFPEVEFGFCDAAKVDRLIDWTIAKWDWSLEQAKPGQVIDVPQIQASEFSYDAIYKLSHGVTVPTVTRGLFKDAPATSKWTHEYFEEKYGENILITLTEARTDMQYEQARSAREVTGSGKGYQDIMRPCKMKVKNVLRRMKEGEKLYISNIDTIFRRNNELIDDLEFGKRIRPWAYDPYSPYAAQMFLGYGSKDSTQTTGTMFHCAASANFFVQAQGAKDWLFVSPRYTIFLRPSLGKMTPAAKASTHPGKLVPMWKTTLQQGDVLLNPPWMWHEIRNREGLNIGVATRENHPAWTLRNNWLFSFLLEPRATPRVAKNMIPAEKKALRLISSIPFLTLFIVYVSESVKGIAPSPLFTAAFNPCDEHDPNSCTSTILDKTVYSDDIAEIPYRE